MKSLSLLKEPWPRIIGIPIVGWLVALIYGGQPVLLEKFLVSTLFVAVMWNGDYYIIKGFRRIKPRLEETHKRIAMTVLGVCIYNISADYLLCNSLYQIGLSDDYWEDNAISNITRNLMITAVIGTLYEAGYFFSKWKTQTIETEQLRNEKLKSELNFLKNQISPHFLFNSLNTLVTLIHEDTQQAAKFTQKLSEVYRYILQYKEREFISLKTELAFCKSYIFLLKMRFEEGLEVDINVSDEDLDKFIVPLTIQMLIENAVKHNVVSKNQPLRIDIYAENGRSLIVKNNLKIKVAEGESMKKGLENIRSRYRLLTEREVDVIRTREHFMVALPLVELSLEDDFVFEEIER